MAEPARSWWDEMRQEAETPPAPPPRRPSRAATVGAAAVAAVVAVGLGWWLTGSDTDTFRNPETTRLQSAAAVQPPAEVDLDQVRRGLDDFRATAPNGPESVARFRDSCEAQARADGRLLDFCLAFDLLAAPDVVDEARRLALVEAAVPAEPAPIRRIEAVRAALSAMGAQPAVAPQAQPPAEASPPTIVASRPSKPIPPRPKPVKTAAAPDPCRSLPTADRLVCTSPALKAQHSRMRAAYESALENGANPLAIDQAQARWRAQRSAARTPKDLSDLYAKRIAELKAAAEEARLTPPS